MMAFANPIYLTVLIIIPVVIWLIDRGKRGSGSIRYSNLRFNRGLKPTGRVRLAALIPWFTVIALVLMIVALARPRVGVKETFIPREGIDIILAIDV
jgi:Ca-activated chloride channel family protein